VAIERVRSIVAARLASNPEGGWLALDEAAALVGACGVPVVSTHPATGIAEAIAVAETAGYPVVMKARSGELVHKSEIGAIELGIGGSDAVVAAYEAMARRLGDSMGGVVIQPTAPLGIEAIVGLVCDPLFGPFVMVGLGGVSTDLLGDRAFAAAPLEPGAGDRLVGSLRSAPLLDGYRGAPVVDRAALAAIVEVVSQISEAVPELVEFDANPVNVTSEGVIVLDAKVRIAPLERGPGPFFRSLRSNDRR
jgi:hypothetical protein